MNYKTLAAASLIATFIIGCSGEEDPITTSSSTSSSSSSTSTSSTSSSSSSGIPSGPAVNIFTDLPDEMRISNDGERLEMGGFYTSKFFSDSEIETVELSFAQSNFKQLLTNNKNSEEPIEATLTYKGKVYQQVGVRYRGQTSYSKAGNKKSLNIDLDWKIDGQDINGFNSFKLNNGYEDTSNMREVLFNNLSILNITAAKASFARVLLNGEDFGVYAKVQKLNKDHVKEWYFDKNSTRWRAEAPGGSFGGGGGAGGFGGFGAGTSSLNDLGADGSSYEAAYTLKNTDVDSWQDLANAAHTLGTTPLKFNC